MEARIEIYSKIEDTRAKAMREHLHSLGFSGIGKIELADVYTIDAGIDESALPSIASMLENPITQASQINHPFIPVSFDYAVEIGFLPGVTDNVGATAKESMEDLLKKKLKHGEGVYSSQVIFIGGSLDHGQVKSAAQSLANPLIQRIAIKSRDQYVKEGGMGIKIPKVRLTKKPSVTKVDILGADDEALSKIGKAGIANPDGSRRGPLALDLTYMKTIQAHFKELGRNPTDIELESIAQTWSEHCKHTIFADPMDEIKDGLYRACIKRATNKIRAAMGADDFCVSVFTDNSGAIIFDDDHLVTDKAETHNSPSALDPFGGSITGIVGVNRDTIGFGLGAKPVINKYGFCFADPSDKSPIYKGKDFTQKMLSPRHIMEGVVAGVNSGGNCSGIPTPQGFVFFDPRYKGKPLVFVGTVGIIPKQINGRPSYKKSARAGDYIVMVGGRVGADGIHGATFSSEAMDSGSPATAVQIGDPITQKKLSDAIVKEARDHDLYNSITDNGAGGLSCSVAEMAKECGGCTVDLNSVPLKYPGLEPWETWISESQERMTLSVPKEKWESFSKLMEERGVEATVIGEFNDSGRAVVEYNGEKILDLDMEFLHDGLPIRPMETTYTKPEHPEPDFECPNDLSGSLHSMLKRLNISSFEFISKQYDHEVQAGSVIKPLQGRGRVNGEASVTKPLLNSQKAVVCSQGINPTYSDIDTYHMAACAIDTAIRNAVAAGANPDYLALMDNFCWCSSNEPERLGQLKAAAKACYDYSIEYGTPFISGKDSMFNDFKGFDENGSPAKISVPPTLLVSSIGVIDEATKSVSIDVKMPGDHIYILGETNEELGASEYLAMNGFIGNSVPKVDAGKNKSLYDSLFKAVSADLVSSAIGVGRGGLGVALAKSAIGGMLGMDISLKGLPGNATRDDYAMFSESQGRIIATIAKEKKEGFEQLLEGIPFACIGTVNDTGSFMISGLEGSEIVNTDVDELTNSYKSTFRGY